MTDTFNKDFNMNLRINAEVWSTFKVCALLDDTTPSLLIRKYIIDYIRTHNFEDGYIDYLEMINDKKPKRISNHDIRKK